MPARSRASGSPQAEVGPIAAYKAILRGYIDRRPAGMRARIADALGKHTSAAIGTGDYQITYTVSEAP